MARIERMAGAAFTDPALGAITDMITDGLVLALRFPEDAPYQMYGGATITPDGTPTYNDNKATMGAGGANFLATDIEPLAEGTILMSVGVPAYDGSGTDYFFPWGQSEFPYVLGKEGINGLVKRTSGGAAIGFFARNAAGTNTEATGNTVPWTADAQHLIAWRWDATGRFSVWSPSLDVPVVLQYAGFTPFQGPITIGATRGSLGVISSTRAHEVAQAVVWDRMLSDIELGQEAMKSIAALARLGITTIW